MSIVLPLLALALQSTTLPPHPRQAEARALLTAVQGQWRCRGEFADGRPIEADLSFEPVFGGLGLRFTHVDRPPHSYRQESHWGFDRESGHIVSLALTGSARAAEPSAAAYVAETWTESSLTLVHRHLLTDPFAPNRFTYTVTGGRLKKTWEVARTEGQWQMGDYLDCDRVG
ncbi:hypothetical protein [Sphingosinicella sp. CPCC 101087]|uniref:hypothetical protein n=1 Tax=Sphingosinicella sp. CPCC 101087 TaxID=2497754 RepID=UPI00101D5477|nr:hypothetical protein [Sphingosinicella sp. CPCC 101087]